MSALERKPRRTSVCALAADFGRDQPSADNSSVVARSRRLGQTDAGPPRPALNYEAFSTSSSQRRRTARRSLGVCPPQMPSL